ncbi:methyltransferase domain-containing protein [Mesorhizobium sp. M1399]|uniref:class I SAM-dependent methyltransferase n=1 Tax=Mesorhizobium sp. M1399 TaxID=2957096 RepID=UPI00333C2B9C
MSQEQIEHDLFLAAFNQNAEHFRSLNTLMWQVPLIAMTLTGGLWYGVSTSPSSRVIQICLLGLATIGNFGLFVALSRIRFIMGRYLEWFEKSYPRGYVKAEGNGKIRGDGLFSGRKIVQRVFQCVLGAAAALSLALLVMTGFEMYSTKSRSISYYDKRAEDLADAYEAISFQQAHPELYRGLVNLAPIDVLDIGAGTGRDAAWMDQQGHKVFAVEPSGSMLQLAKTLHPSASIAWFQDKLPKLADVADRKFDLIILSAVWMHLPTAERGDAIRRLSQLLKDDGLLYLTLRLGPSDDERGLYAVSFDELQQAAGKEGLAVSAISEAPDLLSRSGIRWQRVAVVKIGQQSKLLEPKE